MSPENPVATPVQSPLAALIGEWTGTTATRFMPTDAFETCDVKATMRWVAHGTAVLYEYDGTFNGAPAHGAALLTVDPENGDGAIAWVDSFHSSAAPMLSKGRARPGEVLNVMATYGDEAQPWGWQTVVTQDGPDAVTVQAFNIPYGRERYVAVETKLRRAGA